MKQRALLTGAEQGLGAAIMEELFREGYTVNNIPGNVIRGGKSAIEGWLAQMTLNFDVVINNFGINHLSWVGETPEEDEAILNVNVHGPYWVINGLVRGGNPPARVVNIASQTHRVAQRTTALYCASKAALVQLSRVLTRELAPRGWVINTLAPGKIVGTTMQQLTDAQVTDLREWDPVEADKYALNMIPMGRYTSPEEVARAVAVMLQLPAYVNGALIDMTGGV
jgi:3-oxoacyl-[acyl-carrier protein] reductase